MAGTMFLCVKFLEIIGIIKARGVLSEEKIRVARYEFETLQLECESFPCILIKSKWF